MIELEQLKACLRDARARRHYLQEGRAYARGDYSVRSECHVLEQQETVLEAKIAELEERT